MARRWPVMGFAALTMLGMAASPVWAQKDKGGKGGGSEQRGGGGKANVSAQGGGSVQSGSRSGGSVQGGSRRGGEVRTQGEVRGQAGRGQNEVRGNVSGRGDSQIRSESRDRGERIRESNRDTVRSETRREARDTENRMDNRRDSDARRDADRDRVTTRHRDRDHDGDHDRDHYRHRHYRHDDDYFGVGVNLGGFSAYYGNTPWFSYWGPWSGYYGPSYGYYGPWSGFYGRGWPYYYDGYDTGFGVGGVGIGVGRVGVGVGTEVGTGYYDPEMVIDNSMSARGSVEGSSSQRSANMTTAEGLDFKRRAEAAFRQGNYDQAVRLANHAAVEMPRDGKLFLFISQALFAVGDYMAAAGAAHQGMAMLNPGEWGTVVKNFRQHYPDVNAYTEQLRRLEKFVAENPDAAYAHFLVGFQYGYLGHEKEAQVALEQAIELESRDELAIRLLEEFGGEVSEDMQSRRESGRQEIRDDSRREAPEQLGTPERRDSRVRGEPLDDNTDNENREESDNE